MSLPTFPFSGTSDRTQKSGALSAARFNFSDRAQRDGERRKTLSPSHISTKSAYSRLGLKSLLSGLHDAHVPVAAAFKNLGFNNFILLEAQTRRLY